MNTLQTYTNAYLKLKKFEEANKKIFAKYDTLHRELLKAEQELKKNITLIKKDVENDNFKVLYIARYHKSYDWEKIRTEANEVERGIIETRAVKTIYDVDKAELEKIAKEGLIRRELLARAYQERFLGASVRIALKIKNDHE